MFTGTILRAEPGQHITAFFNDVIRFRHAPPHPAENAIVIAEFGGALVDVKFHDTITNLYEKWIEARFLGVAK